MRYFLSFIFCFFCVSASAQVKWEGDLSDVCSFDPDDVFDEEIYTFSSPQEAIDIMTEITQTISLKPKFKIAQANVPNAVATIKGTDRYILYSQVFMDSLKTGGTNDKNWAAWTVLAHEIGHHLNGHTLVPGGSRPPTELEADSFAGGAIARLGGSLNDALESYQGMSNSGSDTHPGKRARLEAVTNGYTRAKESMGGNTSVTSPPSRTTTETSPPATTGSFPSPQTNPLEVFEAIVVSLRQGRTPTVSMSPGVRGFMRSNRMAMRQQLAMAGPIVGANVMNSWPTPGYSGSTSYLIGVKYQNNYLHTQPIEMTFSSDGTLSGFYFR